MGDRELGKIVNKTVISRDESQAIVRALTISSAVHLKDERLAKGTLMALIVASGLSRAYPEAVPTVDFSAANADFTLDPATFGGRQKYFRVGDVIEGTEGTALGEIATYNPVTGVGTLTGNSANAFALAVRVDNAVLKLADGGGKILTDEVTMVSDGVDEPHATGWIEGFFIKSATTLTDAAVAEMGGFELETGEVRI